MTAQTDPGDHDLDDAILPLCEKLAERGPRDASNLLVGYPEAFVERVLGQLNPALRQSLLAAMPRARRELVLAAASPENRRQWLENDRYDEGTIGRLMEPALAVFPPGATVAEAVARLRLLTSKAIITYLYVADEADRFAGVVVMRDMLLATPDRRLSDLMFSGNFALTPDQTVLEAMRETMRRHYPVYPVVDAGQRIIGLVRGQTLFEAQAVELSAQAGTLVGVREEERPTTPWARSLGFRLPWLGLNLLGTFLAAAAVAGGGRTVARLPVVIVFIPVLPGQCVSIGGQAVAVALRAMALGELNTTRVARLVAKELRLGLASGFLTGLPAGLAMYAAARWQGGADAWRLAAAVAGAMTAGGVVSGLAGALTPVILKRAGFDPAMAAGIVARAVAGVVSLGALLGLAAWLVPG